MSATQNGNPLFWDEKGAQELTDGPIGGYANPVLDEPAGGEPEHEIGRPLGPDAYAEVARGWLAAGARIAM